MDVRRALEDVFLRAAWREPGSRFVDTATVAHLITPSIRFPYANAVYRFDGEEDELDGLLAQYREHGLPVRFIVTPGWRAGLGEWLMARGFKREPDLAAMWSVTEATIDRGVAAIEPLAAATLDEYVTTAAAG